MPEDNLDRSGGVFLGFIWRWAILFVLIPFLVGLFDPIRFRVYEKTQTAFSIEIVLSIVLAWAWFWWSDSRRNCAKSNQSSAASRR